MNTERNRPLKNLYSVIIAFSFIVVLSGCSGNGTTENLPGRYDAASKISDTSKRNSALVAVAKAAGQSGDGEVAKNAVLKISDTSLRSTTAAEVAIALANAGKSDAATEVAQQIAGTGHRNAILEKIATTE